MNIIVYEINTDLPYEFIWRDKEMVNPGEVTPGIYRKKTEFNIRGCNTIDEIVDEVEKQVTLKVGDIVEWRPDTEALQNPSEELGELMKTDCNYFIRKFWGLDVVAIDKESVFAEMTLSEIASMIAESE